MAREGLGRLFEVLRDDGWTVIGPTVRDEAIVYAPIDGPDDLPIGWTDEQAPGRYRLRRRDDDARFGYAVGPHSWKAWLFPAREPLYATDATGGGLEHAIAAPSGQAAPEKRAFLGVRACELAAIAIQDRIFTGTKRREPRYAARRDNALLIAVNCSDPGGLCFCVSMNTGPRVKGGADVVLTELPDRFVVEAGSERGERIVAALGTRPASGDEGAAVDEVERRAAARMGRTLDTRNLPGLLFANLDHARWDEVAQRCLTCGNCTQVCPTCFCSSVEEVSDLDATSAVRFRTWDSCFTLDHSRIHGAVFRPTTKDRYRQWLTHKFGSWVSQFGTSGCVGCGRCVAWCPVGIDVTEELAAIRADGEAPIATPLPPAPVPPAVEDLVPRTGEVVAVERDTADVVTLHVLAPGIEAGDHGQFDMLGLPGFGEAPISLSGTDGLVKVHTIRAVGPLTEALCGLEAGAKVQIRGPYGSTWPVAEARGKPVVVVAGGIALAPLRTAIRAMANDPEGYPDVRVFIGARQPADVLFVHEHLAWTRNGNLRVEVTVDNAGPGWTGHVGVVTRLLRPESIPAGATAFVCGPEKMMQFTLAALYAAGVAPDRCHLSMERHMKCAAGFCGRCQYAHWFVCKDGPVFRADVIAPVFGHDGF